MRPLLALSLLLSVSYLSNAQTITPYADALIRYENETNLVQISDRERIRMIASAGLQGKLSQNWSFKAGLSTGLKNKQNVPAITVAKFTTQPSPDADVYVNQAYLKGTFGKHTSYVGKIPWRTWQVTDAFWDRHLHPLGIHYQYDSAHAGSFTASVLKPLDGATRTVGKLTLLQWQKGFSVGSKTTVKVSPWLAIYRGEADRRYALKDTQLDNTFANFSAQIVHGKWKLGADLSKSVTDRREPELDEFADQDFAYSVELAHGGLKNVGGIHYALRYHNIERFAVVTEFAQNAVTRIATSNFKGIDLRIRKKMAKQWWLGGRLSRSERLIGNEKSTRFRIEAKYTF